MPAGAGHRPCSRGRGRALGGRRGAEAPTEPRLRPARRTSTSSATRPRWSTSEALTTMQPNAMVAAGPTPPARTPLPPPGGPPEARTPGGQGRSGQRPRFRTASRNQAAPTRAAPSGLAGHRLRLLVTFLISFQFRTKIPGWGGGRGGEQTGVLPGTGGGRDVSSRPRSSPPPPGSPPALQPGERGTPLGSGCRIQLSFPTQCNCIQ